jgi:hypothetical protein
LMTEMPRASLREYVVVFIEKGTNRKKEPSVPCRIFCAMLTVMNC